VSGKVARWPRCTKIADLADHEASNAWDLKGGRHCPSYVKGWDPTRRAEVERIYYAGGAANVWGPYTIGYLEWNGTKWVDQSAPVFVANEEWEHGSVYEPNLIYNDGKWKMWYVAGSNQEDYFCPGLLRKRRWPHELDQTSDCFSRGRKGFRFLRDQDKAGLRGGLLSGVSG